MSIQLDIPDSQIGEIKKIYENKFDDLKSKFDSLYTEWEEVFPIFRQLDIVPENFKSYTKLVTSFKNKTDTIVKPIGYDVSGSWADKAEYIIITHGKGRIGDLAEILVNQYEGHLNKKLAANSINATLSVAAKKGRRFTRELNEKGEYVYDVIKN